MTAATTLLKRVFLKTMPAPVVGAARRVHYARQLDRVSPHTEPEMSMIAHLVSPGDRVVDAGANFGVYTRLLSSFVGPEGTVFSFEPVPQTFRLLEANRRHLGDARIELFQAALSDEPGTVRMQVPESEWGAEALYRSHVVSGGANGTSPTFEVECRTLDGAVLDRGTIAFVKIDVEGHELACLRGARKLLARDRPALFVEVSGSPEDAQSPASQLFAMLAGSGYQPWVYDEGRVRPRRPGDAPVNYFFLQPAHLERLKSKGLVRSE